ncbi:transposase [Streptomyces sp. NPDC048332]|uniref:transposase n=1 Tax=unclassified Streptomyces TaxID=2593676 RepID=UPI003439D570
MIRFYGSGGSDRRSWATLEPLLSQDIKAGRPSVHTKRQLINGIRFRTRADMPWCDLPERCGPWETVYGLLADGSVTAYGTASWSSSRPGPTRRA